MEMEKVKYTLDMDSSSHRALARPSLPDQKQLFPAVVSEVVGHDYPAVLVVGLNCVRHYCLHLESAN